MIGVVTFFMMLVGQQVLKRFGWGIAAAVTPVTLLATGVTFFSLVLARASGSPSRRSWGRRP